MRYFDLKSKGLMIGSGIVEAACKTLVTQRLKQSGMRWSTPGAQAILTPRGWDQSERFDEAWALVAATFQPKSPSSRTSSHSSRSASHAAPA